MERYCPALKARASVLFSLEQIKRYALLAQRLCESHTTEASADDENVWACL